MSKKLARAGAIAGLTCISAFAAKAEIIKTARVDCAKNAICLYWWPKLPSLAGWHTEENANYSNGANGINILIPDGSNFANADTVIYANAVLKRRYESTNPQTKTLAAFIADDRGTFVEQHNNMRIEDAAPLTTADGHKLRSLTYIGSGEWERVAYGEEGEYYVLFVINAHSEAGFLKNLPAYESLVRNYRE